MNRFSVIPALLLISSLAMVMSCTKTASNLFIPPEEVHFLGDKTQRYVIETNPAPAYTVKLGVTTVSKEDRTATVEITSPTGAAAGTQYTVNGLTSNSITVPAGSAVVEFSLQGVYSQYTAGRVDTLQIVLKAPSVKPASFNDTLNLILRGPCFDGAVSDINIMLGNYTQTFEGGSGPYTTSIANMTHVAGSTTATAMMNNLFDYFGPVTINFDWTDPANTKAEIPLQITNKEYAAGQPFYVRTKPGQANKFSVCNERITFKLDVLVLISGSLYYYENGMDYVMAR